MPYVEEVCQAGKTIEVRKYYSPRWHSEGEKRAKKEKPTSEAVEKINQRNRERDLRRLMNNNFKDGDLLIRLDFCNKPTGSEEMQELMAQFIRRLRREYSKTETELKYIYVKEVGPRGSRHIHMMLTKCDTDVLRKCWKFGGIHIDPLNSDGQYGKIAAYFIKYALRTEETEERLIGKRWYGSRNLAKPEVKKKVIKANKFRATVKEKNGYYLEKDSVKYGVNEMGYEYFSYTLIKTDMQTRGA